MSIPLVQLAALLAALWVLFKILHSFIKTNSLKNVAGPAPYSRVSGDMEVLFDRHKGWGYKAEIGEKYGGVVHLHGMFGSDVLYVFDPLALQQVLGKDGVYFEQPSWAYAANLVMFGPGILSVRGNQHKRQRKMLLSGFSVAAMRGMTPTFYEIAYKLQRALKATMESSPSHELDVMHWVSRTAMELIGQGGMGHSFDALLPGEQVPNALGEAMKSLSPVAFALFVWRLLADFLVKLGSPQLRRKLADVAVALIPDKNLGKMRDIVNTMDTGSREIFFDKKTALEKGDEVMVEQVNQGKDVMSILLKANARSSANDRLADEEMLAQITTMLFAGTDTTSNVFVRTLQFLAENQQVQDKLRHELTEARELAGEDIPHDQLFELPFLDAVCKESLRLFPPIDIIPRASITDVVMPLHKPIQGVDGTFLKEIVVPKGTLIMPCLGHCNRNKDLWGEDADEWKPERWLSPLPSTVTEAHIPGVYASLMTFGGGPRSCIGMRFGLLEMKVLLAVLVTSFKFSPTDKDITWNFAGISYPTMDKTSVDPSMVLKVEAV